ncbi:hypothetical protein GGS23DRAFT_581053 [Durotheca rogersii]|uniref:uncharacterized protein n=1 Tax=Durotheca rogersii TaxID=419775 RepID=UPI0022205627|nr:uncharacterized protein GGS23DRAFT_581053 [Durotheca rogersii]KAI5860349.1 hypothetical protein GGS23DRAFT_581053 [Durotheca rogersii]
MSRTLEPTLLSLLPTYSKDLPQPLVELASSLLTRSRHSAGTLKAEEEVARAYACAHIACERLKISLDLPPIQPRPPVPPRIYKRLYAHLDNVLPASTQARSGRVRTPSSKVRESGLFGSAQRVPSRGTPTKEQSLAKFRSPAAPRADGTPTKSTGKRLPPPLPAEEKEKKKAGGAASALPAWVRPTIQLLCGELGEERIGRTVLAGMQTIAAPRGRRTADEWVNQNLSALLAAVYFLVSSHVYMIEQGRDMDKAVYARKRKAILDALERARERVRVPAMDEDELWIGWADVATKDVDDAVARLVQSRWHEAEWFDGIKHVVKAKHAEEPEQGASDGGGDGKRFGERLHAQRGDTMLQTRWDLTDQKRDEYRAWRDAMLRRIEEVEQSRRTESGTDAPA